MTLIFACSGAANVGKVADEAARKLSQDDKLKLTPQQIQKACIIGECAPKYRPSGFILEVRHEYGPFAP